jgi:dienelactone hydrolase
VPLAAPGRTVDLELRVSTPADGDNLPVILLSHGHGPSNFLSSLYGYGPLANFYAAHGFAVIQPTHLDSAMLGLREADDPQAPLYWRSRATDMSFILDKLDDVERAVPHLRGRIDRAKIAIVGHSMGGFSASLLLGARTEDPEDGTIVDLADPRFAAGLIMSAPGRGDSSLSDYAAEHYPVFLGTEFSHITTPIMVVRGENDVSEHLTTRGPDWYRDAYTDAPGARALVTVLGGEHGLGGVSGYDASEAAAEENPKLVEAVQQASLAFLTTQLGIDDSAWEAARSALSAENPPRVRIETR